MSFYSDASLVMIPSGYKASKVYSAVPTDGAGDLVFTRALDTATRVGPDGLIEKVRTNVILHSEDITNVAWATNAGPIRTANTTIAPNGTLTADTIASTGASSGVYQVPTVASGVEHSFSVYIKNITTATNLQIGCDLGPTNGFVNFNAVTGLITSAAAGITGSSVTDAGNGWYRVSGTYNSTGTTNTFIIFGQASMTFAVWGCQFETGVTTTYIPTTTAAVSVGMLANVPRLDYLGGGCPKLLLEPQRTNLTEYSEQLNNAYWIKTGSTASANVAVSPDGFTNADLLTESATTADHAFFDVVSYFVSGTTYTLSFFAKANGRTKVEVVSANSNTCPKGRFDLVAQTAVGTDGSFGAKIESYGNGWFRCSVSRVAPNTGLDVPYHAMVQSFGTITYAGNGTSGVFFYGMQTEVGSYATSYIPTLGAAVTRSADAASKTGISALIGQTEGTLFVDFIQKAVGASVVQIQLNDGSNSNRVQLEVNSNGFGVMYVFSGGGLTGEINLGAFTTGTRYKIAMGYKVNDFVAYINGVLTGTDTSGAVPVSMSRIDLGAEVGTPYTGYELNQALLFKTRLTNAQLEELTA